MFRSAWAFDAFFTVPRCICKTFEWFVDLLVQFVHYRCHFRDPGKLSALRKWSGRSSIGNLTGDTVKFLLSERWWLLCNKLRTNFLSINWYNFQTVFCEIYRGIKCLWRPNDFSVHRLPFEYRPARPGRAFPRALGRWSVGASTGGSAWSLQTAPVAHVHSTCIF